MYQNPAQFHVVNGIFRWKIRVRNKFHPLKKVPSGYPGKIMRSCHIVALSPVQYTLFIRTNKFGQTGFFILIFLRYL